MCSGYETRRRQQGTEEFGGWRSGRPWPEKISKKYRKEETAVCIRTEKKVAPSTFSSKIIRNSYVHSESKGTKKALKADSHIACRAHTVPLPCRAAKGLECVFPI